MEQFTHAEFAGLRDGRGGGVARLEGGELIEDEEDDAPYDAVSDTDDMAGLSLDVGSFIFWPSC